MKYRNLRIAWSAFFGILCLLLIVLWVRSYRKVNHVARRLATSAGLFNLLLPHGATRELSMSIVRFSVPQHPV